jgi:NitT/TauT family transport system substrate-binding protein
MHLRRGALLSLLLVASGCGGAPAAQSPSASLSASAAAKPAASSAVGSASAKPGASTAASAAAKPASSTSVKVAYSQPAAGFAPVWVAQDKGFFKKYGLDAEVLQITPPADTQSVISGEIQFDVDGSGSMAAIASGANIPYIAITVPYFAQSLYGQSSIQKVSDLVGKQVATTTRGGSSDFALRTLLAKENVDPAKINFVYLRDDAAILAAMQAGTLQAAIITSPNTLRAKQSGLREIVDMSKLRLRTLTQGVNVRKEWAQQHEDLVLAFLKAWMEGAKEGRSNPDGTKAIIGKYTKVTDQAFLDEAYNTVVSLWAAYPLANDQDLQNVIDLSTEANVKAHTPADYYDNSYLQKLDSFVKQLYPGGVPQA